MADVAPSVTRRGLLAAVGVGTSALAGCSERLWSQAETTGSDQVSLRIKAVPADDDYFAATIASQLRENYAAAGIDATHEPVSKAELHRDILLEGDYDVFVARQPGLDEYDALYELLHSRFVSEPGWQNPFYISDVTSDDYLEIQREADESERQDVLVDLIEHLLRTTPYSAVTFPYTVSGVAESFSLPTPPRRPHEYLELLSYSENEPRDGPLEVGVFGEHLTERLNPITVDRNRISGLLGLVYDPLARQIGDEYVPWLAEDVEWTTEGRVQARVTLREGVEWHDGESLDADDVAFTLDFIGDTSMGEVDGGAPAPRYRGRQTLLGETDVIDSRTIELSFPAASQMAARRLLTIPVLPAHIWEDRSEVIADRQTRALTTNNEDPVGSGLFAFSEATTDVEVELEPFDGHVLRETTDRPEVLENFSQFEGLTFRIAPNPGAMGDALVDGDTDVTASELPPGTARDIRTAATASTVTGTTNSFYMVGYNSRQDELGNPNFRQLCSRLIDREHAVGEFFEGFAQTATTPAALVGISESMAFDSDLEDRFESDPLSFPGTDGELNTSRVQSLFEEIGYRYEDGLLLK